MMKDIVTLVVFSMIVCMYSPCYAEATVTSSMSALQIRSLKTKHAHETKLNVWAISGYEMKYLPTSCITNRNIYLFSAPVLIRKELLEAKVTEIEYRATNNLNGRCISLVRVRKRQLYFGQFVKSKQMGIEIIDRHDSSNFFIIKGGITIERLFNLKSVISEVDKCISAHIDCNKKNYTVSISLMDRKHLNAIKIANISSIEEQLSPNHGGPFLILFRPYTGTELILIISNINNKHIIVNITRLVS